MSKRRYFGTDGIRGKVGQWPISADFVLRLGRAAGKVLTRGGEGTVLIGKDTRISGYMFESALEAGLVAAGCNVRLLGPMPTPAVAYLTRTFHASAGIVISASHNPHHDNGIKFFSAAGEKLDDEIEREIEDAIDESFDTVASDRLGKVSRIGDAAGRYIEFCKSTVPVGLDLRGLKIVLDCANGATYHVAPRVFTELGAEVLAIHAEPDGLNINKACGSTDLQSLRAAVLDSRADFGIAFDGDGDRVQFVAADGRAVDGDDLIFILAGAWKASGRLRGTVVGTLMTNFGLEQALAQAGIPFGRAQVGDRHVHRMLVESGGTLGGEASGHLLCLDRATTGDAIVSALQVIEALKTSGQDLVGALSAWRRYPQKTINVPVVRGFDPMAHAGVQSEAASIESELAGAGRLVLRASGTEPVVRVTIEAAEDAVVDALSARLARVVGEAALGD